MPHKRDDGTTQMSLKLPQELLDNVEAFAEERRWSRSKAINVLLSEGITGPDHGVELSDEPGLVDNPVSVGTKDEDMVRNIGGLADKEYDGSFNAAARWALRNGLAEMTDL